MDSETNISSLAKQQKQSLEKAKVAAKVGDPKGMLEALVESRVLDGLRRRLDFAWGNHIHPMDCDNLVGDTIDAFYAAVQRGEPIGNISAWLSKVVTNLASAFNRDRQFTQELDAAGMPAREENEPRELTEAEREARRRRCLEVARSLLPLLSVSDNIRRVMAYIFDAVEQRVEDLQPVEIARALGVKEGSVRTWIARGFERLTARAKEAGYTRDEYELIQAEFEESPDQGGDSEE